MLSPASRQPSSRGRPMRADDTAPDPAALETAADWIDRLDELTVADQRSLHDWLRASPDHARAFDRMRHTLRDPALVLAAERVRALPYVTTTDLRPAGPASRVPPSVRRGAPFRYSLIA